MTSQAQRKLEPTRVEMLKALVVMTETGYPAHHTVVQHFWKHAHPAPEEGWWWIGATPLAAAAIRSRGHRARGTLVTTFFPPQPAITFDLNEFHMDDVPAIGSPEFHAEVHLSAEKRRELVLQRKDARVQPTH